MILYALYLKRILPEYKFELFYFRSFNSHFHPTLVQITVYQCHVKFLLLRCFN